MDLRAELWSQLPYEIVEDILSFLHVPDLCRCRSVCKEWNEIICKYEFGALCIKNVAKRDASFIVVCFCSKEYKPKKDRYRWCFLDLNARRWYTIKDVCTWQTFIERFGYTYDSRIEAMDGGLVCTYFPDVESFIVYNPIAKIRKELPSVPRDHLTSLASQYLHIRLEMVVDSTTQKFKILFSKYRSMEHFENPNIISKDRIMHIYDSTTNEWKSLTRLWQGSHMSNSVMFQGCYYVLFKSFYTREYLLWRYNSLENAWENLAIHMPSKLAFHKLLVIANRLIMVESKSCTTIPRKWQVEVSQIKVSEMARDSLLQFSEANMVKGFESVQDFGSIEVRHAFGFGNSIMFMPKTSGNLIGYDLVTRAWDPEWPQIPLINSSSQYDFMARKQMDLILPNKYW